MKKESKKFSSKMGQSVTNGTEQSTAQFLQWNELMNQMDEIKLANAQITVILDRIKHISKKTSLLAIDATIKDKQDCKEGASFSSALKEISQLSLEAKESVTTAHNILKKNIDSVKFVQTGINEMKSIFDGTLVDIDHTNVS